MAGIQKTLSKGIAYLKKRGIRKTVRKTVLHIDRKRLEHLYVRRMTPSGEELAAQRKETFSRPVRFSVIVPLYNTPMALLRETVDSVRKQSYENWELCLADGSDEAHAEVGAWCRQQRAEDPRILYRKLEKNGGISGNTNAALAMATGEYAALFDHDDLLTPDALYEMAKAIEKTDADFLYSDELIFSSPRVNRIVGIRFKPDFAPEDLLTNNYICHLTVFRRSLLEQTGGFRTEFDGSQDHDLVLRLTAAAERIVHVPKILYLWRSVAGSVAADVHMKEYAIDAGRRAVETFLHSRGQETATVESTEVFPTMYRVRVPIAGQPSVRIILDAAREAGDIRGKLQELQARTTWPNCAWTVTGETGSEADKNGNDAGGAGRDAGITGKSRRERFTEAASDAKEDYLVFVDGIPEPQNPDWIQELLMPAQAEETGAVGARIRFAGGTDLRHAGILLGLGTNGIAGRPYFDREDDLVGFFGQLAVTRNVSAVTDCWMIRREKYERAGGFDARYADALFDIDLCMRLRAMGYRNLWTPYACLRGGRAPDYFLDVGAEYASYPRDSALFREKWTRALAQGDPYYNPNLSLKYEDWRIDGEKIKARKR